MLCKQVFKKLMNRYIALKKKGEAVSDAIKAVSDDWCSMFGYHEELFIDTLKAAMNDPYDGWISYWVYDCNMGKDSRKVSVDGEEIRFKTVDDLYAMLINKPKFVK